MEIWTIYKMEMIKTLKRKNSLILLIPSILVGIMAFGISTGGLTFTGDALSADGKFACLDFITTLWLFFSALGVWGILLILITAFQFSGEISSGQIKMTLLRIGKRGPIVFAKFLALLTTSFGAFALFTLTAGGGYYLFIANSDVGNGHFSSSMIDLPTVIATIGFIFLHLALFMAVTLLIGLFLSPFIAFIFSLVSLFAVNYLINTNALELLKYSALSISNNLIAGKVENVFPTFLLSIALIICLLLLTSLLFKRVDIK